MKGTHQNRNKNFSIKANLHLLAKESQFIYEETNHNYLWDLGNHLGLMTYRTGYDARGLCSDLGSDSHALASGPSASSETIIPHLVTPSW